MIIMVTILMRCRCKFYKVFKIRSMCPTYIWSADRSSLTIIIFFRHGLIKNIVLKFCEIKFSMNNSDLMKTRQWYHFNDFVHKAFYRHTTHQWFSKKKITHLEIQINYEVLKHLHPKHYILYLIRQTLSVPFGRKHE